LRDFFFNFIYQAQVAVNFAFIHKVHKVQTSQLWNTNKLCNFIKIQHLYQLLLTFRQPLLPSSESTVR